MCALLVVACQVYDPSLARDRDARTDGMDGAPETGDSGGGLDAPGLDAPTVDAPPWEAGDRADTLSPPDARPLADAPSGDCGGRALEDRPDESALYQVHAIYLLPSDGVDRELDLDGTLATSVAAWNRWLSSRADGATLRLDLCAGGGLDITFHQLDASDAEVAAYGRYARDFIEAELATAGFDVENKAYAVYYEGTSTATCADAAYPPGLIGRASVIYLDGLADTATPCRVNMFARSVDAAGYLEHVMLHDLFHIFGAAADCAPSFVGFGHVGDSPNDLMYGGDMPWIPTTLDVGGDDYFGHGRADCVDVARSVFIEPLPTDPVLPPGW
jgi:hypothetical protein